MQRLTPVSVVSAALVLALLRALPAAVAAEPTSPASSPATSAAAPGGVAASAPTRTLVIKPLVDALDDRAEPMVIGGVQASPGAYPASFQVTTADRICTWFLVGSQALLSAAHCVAGADATEPVANVELPMAGKTFKATCSISAGYWKDRSQDWTACRIAEPVPVPGTGGTGMVGFEVLDGSLEALAVDLKVEISGYGCVTPNGAPVPGYRIGTASVRELPPDALLPQAAVQTPNAIKLAQSPAILCEGDSGGPAFRYVDNIRRVVIGINSRTLIKSRISFLASVSTSRARTFLSEWAAANHVTICGLHPQAANCRPS